MDKTFILMCEKAVEIQELWKPFMGDYISFSDGTWKLIRDDSKWILDKYKKEGFWLPNQKQLQDIANSFLKFNNPLSLCFVFDIFCRPPIQTIQQDTAAGSTTIEITNQKEIDYSEQFTTMEQLWLAFTMWELYEKRWNGKEWIK